MTRPGPAAVGRASGADAGAQPRPPEERLPEPGGGGPPRWSARRRRQALLAGLVVLTVLFGGGTWAVYGSSWFRATRVGVDGTRELTPAAVEKAAAVPLGGPLASVDTGAVRKRLLAELPRIEDVDVERSWPHTIRVKVTERTPSAVLKSGKKFTEVDRTGVRFATVDQAPRGVPLVQLTPDQSASFRHFGTKGLLRAAIAVAGDLPESLHGRATAIRVRSYDSITVELTGGRMVMWGSAEAGTRKASVLTALMKAQPDATRFDVSAPTAPAASGS